MSKKKPESEAAAAETVETAQETTAETAAEPAAHQAPPPDPAPAEPPTGGLWREAFDLMMAGEPVLIRSAIANGRLKSIAAGGVVTVELPDGQDGLLPTVLGDQAAYELVQDLEGAYILRDLGRGRETVGTSSESTKHFFSAAEMAELAREMDDAHQAAQTEALVLAGLQVKVKASKGAMEGHLERAAEVSQRRRQGWEMREYPCLIVKDYVRGVKEIVREDTGDLIKDMALADSERQGSLPLADQPESEAAGAGETCCHRCGTVTALDGEGFAPEGWKRTPGSDPAEWTCPDCLGVKPDPQEGEEQAAEPGEAAEIAAQAEMVEGDGSPLPCENLEARAADCHPCADAGACPSCCAACLMRANADAVPADQFQRPDACQPQEAAA
ncbi:MAG: hypothetical protein ACOZHQ_09340 [Thermodesulfobacteriota bacterium]